MAARFNKHIPKLCADCGKPLSVAEKRIAGLCTWDAYMLYRKEFDELMDGGMWMPEPVQHNERAERLRQEEPETFWISESNLF